MKNSHEGKDERRKSNTTDYYGNGANGAILVVADLKRAAYNSEYAEAKEEYPAI